VRPLAEGRWLVRFDLALPNPGEWHLEIDVESEVGVERADATLTVRAPGNVPAPGRPAPSVATPTAADVAGNLARITSDPIPEPAFYWLSAADALALGRPFALVLDSFRFRETQACGGALGIVRHLAHRFGGVSFIHAEPYVTRWNGATLSLDPPTGPGELAEWSIGWGVDQPDLGPASIPWIFVVDRSGVVRATFQGIVGTDELALALGDVAPWTPSDGVGGGPTPSP
jgi:hypothetical protein